MSRAALVVVAIAAAMFGGCGGDSDSEDEKAADVELLNGLLAQELTAAQAYAQGARLLRGELRPLGRELRAHAQEHVSAITKAMRGLGGQVEAEAEELDYSALESQADFLTLAYELENTALDAYLDAVPQLETYAPRTLAASIAASHAQHLVVLRQGLGAGLASAVPDAQEPGDLPPPPAPTRPVEPGSAG